jgi:hypothetical protein
MRKCALTHAMRNVSHRLTRTELADLTKKIHTSCSAAADLCGDALG